MTPYPRERIISAHPVDVEVHAVIAEQLERIEQHHQVTVLFACESGSRGWGFASPDSDYDVRFIYVPRLSWYLRVRPGRDVIEQPITAELDMSGWELRKALGLLSDSNPTLAEWLDSPIIYQQAQPWTQRLHALVTHYFMPERGYHHYVSMAKKNLRIHLQEDTVRYKKYFYSLRPLLAARWIRERGSLPPMRFAALASQLLDDAVLIDEINALLKIKMRLTERNKGPRLAKIHDFLESELEAAQKHVVPASRSRPTLAAVDTFLHEAVLHFSGIREKNGHFSLLRLE